jgi:serine/threonine protein kinase
MVHLHPPTSFLADDEKLLKSPLCVWEQIASGLAHMHDYGILHRDMKPENCIFVDEPVKCLQHGITPSIKIIDLGMACLYDADRPVKGMPAMFRGENLSRVCDVESHLHLLPVPTDHVTRLVMLPVK